MAVTPRRSLDDYSIDNFDCAICGQPTLRVMKVSNLPDFVSCTSCQAAYIVEQDGPHILYGQIPQTYPKTREYALKKWMTREQVEMQARLERPAPPLPAEPAPAPQPQELEPAIDEAAVAAPTPAPAPSADIEIEDQPVSSAIFPEQTAPPDRTTDAGPPSFSGVDLGQKPPEAEPPLVQPNEGFMASDDRAVEAEAPEPAQVEQQIDTGGLQIDLPKADDFPSPDPEKSEPDLPDWLKPPEDTATAEPEAPDAETVHLPEDPFAERLATQDEIQAVQQARPSDPDEIKHGIEWPSDAEEMEDESNLPDWLQPQKPTPTQEKTPDLSRMPGVPIPTEPLSEPVGSGIALESQPHLRPRHRDTLPQAPGAFPGIAREQKPPETPAPPTPGVQSDISRPVEDVGPGFDLTQHDPAAGERYRVVIKGVKVQLPTDFCAHCGRSPVKGRVVVMGSLPSSKILGQRTPSQFNIPLCADCAARSQHPREEVQSARLQASLLSTLGAVVVLVLGLVFGLVNLSTTSLPNLLILLVLAAIGYAIPAVILFGRIQDLPVTPEMHYIQTTLIMPSETQGLETAFEWRNPLYAQRFVELNQQNVVGPVSQVKERPQ